eukprot:c17526_g1_i1.p1 GENE.c17526_g1_i1~~c17526_g1_i1.p1  ORF type:complete len:195 (-),score=33.64 c17526_g1_i1:31-615(-)
MHALRRKILETSLQLVPQEGWTVANLARACEQLQLSPASQGLFPRGGAQIIEFFHNKSRETLKDACNVPNWNGMDKMQRLSHLMRTRLEHVIPLHGQWPQAIAIQSMPQNLEHSIRNNALLVDEVCHLAGLRSASMRWYADRAVVAVTYSACELHLIADSSPDYQETWDFLERRIGDLREGEQATQMLPDWFWK